MSETLGEQHGSNWCTEQCCVRGCVLQGNLQIYMCSKLPWQLIQPTSPVYETLQSLVMNLERCIIATCFAQ